MKIYELGIDDKTNWEWRAVLPNKEDERLKITETLNIDKPLLFTSEDVINMVLINGQSVEENRKETPFKADLIYWTNDLTLNANSPNNGCIVSEKLLKLLRSFNLPEYHYYPINLINAETKDISNNYFLLQIITPLHQNTDFTKSHYKYIQRRSKEIVKEEMGAFDSFESYSEAYDKLFFENKIRIDISKRALKVKYDIIWSVINYLRIVEEVKKKILASDLNGVKVSDYTGFEIISDN
ncbi:MAG: hypothetical protein CL613_00580 [Aquimarina sp.]|nr:hypothetical protein [Aquimarina sp.]